MEKKRDSYKQKENSSTKDEVSVYRLEENTLDYVLHIIRELTVKL